MTWVNLLIILFSCAIFVFIKNILTKHKREIKLLLLMVFMDSFLVMFQVMIINMFGLNYGYLDEVLVSFLYSMILPSAYVDMFENSSTDKNI